METEWRRIPINGCRNYEVSSDGKVRRNGRVLATCTDRYGYQRVGLYYAGLRKRCKVHRLVCETFHGPAPDGTEACHIDGNPGNNSVANLKWGTRSENVKDAVAHGTHNFQDPAASARRRGSRSASSKLTEDIVVQIRARAAQGESGRALAREFGITSANMSKIIRGERWAHVPKGCAKIPQQNQGVSND